MMNIIHNGNTTVAIDNNCTHDALDHVQKVFESSTGSIKNNIDSLTTGVPEAPKAFMPNTISAVVRCHEGDNYSEDVGTDEAVKKAMFKHHKAFKKALLDWQRAIVKDIIAVSPDTFGKAIREAIGNSKALKTAIRKEAKQVNELSKHGEADIELKTNAMLIEWQREIIKGVISASPETFDEALKQATESQK